LQNRGYLSTWASTFAAKGRAFAPYICRVSQTHVNPVRTYFYILLGISLRENKCCASSNGGDFRENKRRRVKKGRWMEVGLKLCNIYLQWIFYGILSIFGTISQGRVYMLVKLLSPSPCAIIYACAFVQRNTICSGWMNPKFCIARTNEYLYPRLYIYSCMFIWTIQVVWNAYTVQYPPLFFPDVSIFLFHSGKVEKICVFFPIVF
jgi:hypothetical protein